VERKCRPPEKEKEPNKKCHLKAGKYARKQTNKDAAKCMDCYGCFDCHMDHQSPKYAEMVP
jgi:hypothetical protein